MLPETYNALTEDEQLELETVWPRFIEAVQATQLSDGWEFCQRYAIKEQGGFFVLSDGRNSIPEVATRSKRVMEALLEDAAMNYGR